MEYQQSATMERHGGYGFGNHQEAHHYDYYQQNHQDYHHSGHHHHHLNDEPIASYDGGSGGFGSHFRKRRWQNFANDAHTDSGSHAKLYIQPVPRAANEEDVWPVFANYGRVFEVILPRDKRTNQRLGGYCFVKYATAEEADTAIRALDNQYTFHGEMAPIRVKYADGERGHASKPLARAPVPGPYTGASVENLYIGGLSRQTSKQEIQEVFSAYGVVEDIYIVVDEMNQSRGYGFVKFSHRDMALAAIRALNENFTMRGCHQPLVVRFADPKKPRTGESRPGPGTGDSMGGHFLPNTSYSVANSSNSQLQPVSSLGNQKMADPSVVQPPLQSPLQWTPKAPQQIETPRSCQSSQQSMSEIQKQSHPIQISTQNLKQQQSVQVAAQETVCNPQTAATSSTIGLPSNQLTSTYSLECDWSEHTCPDGCKYYYNCMTCESKWEKPGEFVLFEQQLEKQQKLQNPSQLLHSPLLHISAQQLVETQKLKLPMEMDVLNLKDQLEEPSSLEMHHPLVRSERSPVTCV
ncbi:flowering time control protein FCA isoform X2 [Tripterygium wilfordii]|nr:flowering time control protein FCA isoform X2 [Tripterygium wilfordii]